MTLPLSRAVDMLPICYCPQLNGPGVLLWKVGPISFTLETSEVDPLRKTLRSFEAL